MKKITVYSEIMYIIANCLMAFSVALLSNVDFGISHIVCPSYILSEAVPWLTFGQCEYIFQFLFFIAICVLVKKFRFSYLCAFITGLFYGTLLDVFRLTIPFLHPGVRFVFWLRIILFIVGELITALGVAMYFKVYFPPQVYDFFVKILSNHFHVDRILFKRLTDLGFFIAATAMTLLIFHKFVGVGWGTVIITLVNGILIGLFEKILDHFFEFKPLFPKLEKKILKDSE